MKKWLALFLSVATACSLTGCNFQEAEKASWSIYWYLCGSELESDGGFASADLAEMMEVSLPDNVRVVVQTGGAARWQNEQVDATKLQRYVYDKEGIKLVEEQPSANMGESGTLESFLSFAQKNYPADKTAVLFWNHGGGSVAGVAFDELYDLDSLTLDELHTAFDGVWDLSPEKPPVDLIGFDTCLMATLDVAHTFSDIGKYLVASEEVEPGNGWLYSGWLGDLAKNPNMDASELGKVICDTYQEGCEELETAENITISLTNLSKVAELVEAYDAFGVQALVAASKDAGFFSKFGRLATATENYGGNTKDLGFTNMVDMGHLARQASSLLPDAARQVNDALNSCVEYKVAGPYRKESTGLACYYSYNGDEEDFNKYADLGAGTAFKHFYSYGLTGKIDEAGQEYLKNLNIKSMPKPVTLPVMNWDGLKPEVDKNGYTTLTLGEKAESVLASIGFQLYYVDVESDRMLLLGSDNDIEADWEKGVFRDNFRGKWGALDGNLVYMEVYYESADYNLYAVPLKLNGEECNLMVVYDFDTESWTIQGARKSLNETGMADKNLRKLKVGDKITAIHYSNPISSDHDDLMPIEASTFTVTEDTVFGEMDLGDGQFIMIYEMWDAQGNYAYSEKVVFDCKNGEISTSVCED